MARLDQDITDLDDRSSRILEKPRLGLFVLPLPPPFSPLTPLTLPLPPPTDSSTDQNQDKFSRGILISQGLTKGGGTGILDEMELVTTQFCCNDGWTLFEIPGSKGNVYEVLVQRPDDEDGVICSCRGFHFTGTCKHVQIALDLVCDWTSREGEAQTPEQLEDKICPRCGAQTQWELEYA